MKKKFAFIGAGSMVFVRNLVRDILSFPVFQDCEIALMDINTTRLKYAEMGVKKIIEAGNYPATVTATTDRRAALKGADGVLITILQGGLDVWRHDTEIPMKYGVDICVGDTRGPAGIFRFLRTAPVMLDIIRDAEELCPNAIVLNYTNPMSMLVNYLQCNTDMSVTGLCHSVQGTAEELARWIGAKEEDVTYTCAGINHEAFYLDFKVKGEDAYPLLKEAIKRDEVWNEDRIRIELFKHLGYFPTESSGHSSEYYAWFRKRQDIIDELCQGTSWNPGEHAYLIKFYENREATWEQEYLDSLQKEVDLNRGKEYASNIFNAIFGDNTPFEFNANLRNHNYITNLGEGVGVEVPSIADVNGIRACKQITLPQHLAVLVGHASGVEQLAVSAALEGNPEKVLHAIMMDPLTSAVCSLDEIRRMVKEMFEKNASYLGYFKSLDI